MNVKRMVKIITYFWVFFFLLILAAVIGGPMLYYQSKQRQEVRLLPVAECLEQEIVGEVSVDQGLTQRLTYLEARLDIEPSLLDGAEKRIARIKGAAGLPPAACPLPSKELSP